MNSCHYLRPKPSGSIVINPDEELDNISKSFMLHGISKKKDELTSGHPLEFSEKNFRANLEMQDYIMLRNIQGLHAPLRLQVERKIARQVGRLNCLPSSNIMLDTLTGRMDAMDFQDVLQDPFHSERAGHPHVLMEKQLGIL